MIKATKRCQRVQGAAMQCSAASMRQAPSAGKPSGGSLQRCQGSAAARPAPGRVRQRMWVSATQVQDPWRLLRVERGSSRAEVRAAYIERIKLLHPDVNQNTDTTQDAAALNAAYEAILTGVPCGCTEV